MADEQLENWIAAKLSRSISVNDIVQEICETRGIDWRDAELMVRQVSESHGTEIARRRTPVLMVIGGVTVLAGAFILISGGLAVWTYMQQILGPVTPFSLALLGVVLAGNFPLVGQLFVGLFMIIGGAWGMGRAVGSASE